MEIDLQFTSYKIVMTLIKLIYTFIIVLYGIISDRRLVNGPSTTSVIVY